MKRIALIILVLAAPCFGAYLNNAFNSGELDPLIRYRVDLDRKYLGVETMENFLVEPQGLAQRRPGTMYVATAATPDAIPPTRPPIAGSPVIGISTAADLQLVGSTGTGIGDFPTDGDYELLNDINLTGIDWVPLNYASGDLFTGTFDGRYFAISNMTITVDNVAPDNTFQGIGLFAQTSGGTIRRIILTDA